MNRAMFSRNLHVAQFLSILLACIYFSVKVDAYWSPFGANSKQGSEEMTDQYSLEDATTLLRAESIAVPNAEALAKDGNSNSWCAMAARAAEKKCTLLVETERMQLATLVANCHLETINRPPVKWDPKYGLRDVSDEHQTLVVVVASQLETHCSSFGVSWSHASATEIQAHLAKLRFAAEQIVNSTAESVDTAERMEFFSAKLEDMQSAFVAHAETFQTLSAEVSQQLKLVEQGERKASELYLGAEEKFRAYGTSLTQSVESLPEAANTFLKNSERFEALLQEQRRLTDLQGAPATTTSFLIAAFIVSAGFLYSGRPFLLLFLSFAVFVLKILAEAEKERSRGRAAIFLLDPFVLIFEAGYFLLSLIPHQALALSASMAVGWVFSPDALQKSFLGDRSMLASARLEAVEAQTLAHERGTKCQKMEEEVATLKENMKIAASTNSQLERKVRDNANLHRELEIQLVRVKAEAANRTEKARKLHEENAKLKAERENFERKLALKNQEIEKQIASLTESEAQRNEERAQQHGDANTAIRAEVQTLQAERTAMNTQLHRLHCTYAEQIFEIRGNKALLQAKDDELAQMVRAKDEMTAELERKEEVIKLKDAELEKKQVELIELQTRDIEIEEASKNEVNQREGNSVTEEADSPTAALREAKRKEEAARRKVVEFEGHVNALRKENEREVQRLQAARIADNQNAATAQKTNLDEIDALRKKVRDFEAVEASNTQEVSNRLQESQNEAEALRKRLLHLEEKGTSAALELANLKKRQQRSKAPPPVATRSKSVSRSDKNTGGLGSRQMSAPYIIHAESSDDDDEAMVGAGNKTSAGSKGASGSGTADGDKALQHSLDTPPARASRDGASSGRSHASNAADKEYRTKLRSQTPLKKKG